MKILPLLFLENHSDSRITQPIYKKCLYCGELFPTTHWNLMTACNNDRTTFLRMFIQNLHHNRNIPVKYLDLYDEEGHHLCRVCGKLLMNKNGGLAGQKRHCSKLCKSIIDDFFWIYNWQYLAEKYKWQLYRQQNQTEYKLNCEKCQKLCEINKIAIHHKKAVCLTTLENWEMIFNSSNFEGLCKECHAKSHKEIYQQQKIFHKQLKSEQIAHFNNQFKKLDQY